MVVFLLLLATYMIAPLAFGIVARKRGRSYGKYGVVAGLLIAACSTAIIAKVPSVRNTVYEMVEPEETIESPRYLESSFRKVRIGMSQSDVRSLLGDPLERVPICPGTELWRYTAQGPKDISYRVRSVEFTGNTVSRIERYFFVD